MMNYLDNEIEIIEQKKLEKVIKALECRLDINGSKYKHCLNCDYRHDIDHCQWACQTDGILEDALSLLEAQKTMEPELITETLPHHYACSACGLYLPFVGAKYCSYCGQAVKWK